MKFPVTLAVSITVSIAVVTSGCATGSNGIASSYTSPMQFQSYDCEQLASEAQRLQGRSTQLGARLDQAASADAALVGVGLLLFWPALFALGGTKAQEADYARMKGEYDAIVQSGVIRKCPGMVAKATPTGAPMATTVLAAEQAPGKSATIAQ